MSGAGLILALIGAGRFDEAGALMTEASFTARRAVWRDRAARGAQWYATPELAAALLAAVRGDVAQARRMVAQVHTLLGRERFTGVDSDIVATLAAICLAANEPERARELLTDSVHVGRTPVTNAFTYRTLAAASGHRGRDTIEWRTAELVRRSALDRTTVDAAARRMVERELARLGL